MIYNAFATVRLSRGPFFVLLLNFSLSLWASFHMYALYSEPSSFSLVEIKEKAVYMCPYFFHLALITNIFLFLSWIIL